ncbi:MAG: hypothetical protein IKA63_05620 [Clostridia bacterium]|nr:hypothetical protein [Clostridia bacterium]
MTDKRRIIIGVFTAILVVALLLVGAWFFTRPTYVFSVNGVKVEQEELLYMMGECRLSVAYELEERYGVDSGDADFWEREFGGETPNEVLRRAAAEAIIADKVQLLEAKKYDIKVDLTYSAVESARQAENRKRAQGGEEIVYGPDELTYHVFYVGYLSGIQDELKDKLQDTVLAVSDQDITAYYEQNREAFAADDGAIPALEAVREQIQIVLENQRYDAYVQQLTDTAQIEFFSVYDAVSVEHLS